MRDGSVLHALALIAFFAGGVTAWFVNRMVAVACIAIGLFIELLLLA